MRDLSGQSFGRLTVSSPTDKRRHRHVVWLCLCECGETAEVSGHSLTSGLTRSCGCLRREKSTARCITHGHAIANTGTYISWSRMKSRCSNSNATGYEYYGGRGISVCDRWGDFERFLEDMGERPEGTSIDRIDNYKGYSPDNCRWADRVTQANNRR